MNAGTGKEGVNGCAANSVLSITVKQKNIMMHAKMNKTSKIEK